MNESLSMDQVFINKLTEIVQTNLADEKFGVEELVKEAGMSRSRIHRKLRSINHQSISQFIREIRLQSAMEMLQQNLGTASEIAFRTGFGSPTYFNKCFHDYYGYPPGEVKKREALTSEAELTGLDQIPSDSDIQIRKPKRITFVVGSLFLIISIGLIFIFDMFSFFHNDNFTDIIDKDGRISLVVMPFDIEANDSNSFWQDIIQVGLIQIFLQNPEDFRVVQEGSINSLMQGKGISKNASITSSIAREISHKLDANLYITGSISQMTDTLSINAKLIINSKTVEILKHFTVNGSPVDIIPISDSLSKLVWSYLSIYVMQHENPLSKFQPPINTRDVKAYEYYIYGNVAFYQGPFQVAIEHYRRALEYDPNILQVPRMISWSYFNMGLFDSAKVWCLRAYSKKDQMTPVDEILTEILYASLFGLPDQVAKGYKILQIYNDQNPNYYEQLGFHFNGLSLYDNAIPELEKSLEIYDKWNIKPRWEDIYIALGKAYHETGQYAKEKKLYKKATRDFPDHFNIIERQAILSLSRGEKKAADEYIGNFTAIRRGNSWTEQRIIARVAHMYTEAGILDTAEAYYRKALSLEPESSFGKRKLARFLIDNDRKISEGLRLIDDVLEMDSDDFDNLRYNYLHYKGWALYKMGEIAVALEFLKKSDSLKPRYNPVSSRRLSEVEKALSNQRSN